MPTIDTNGATPSASTGSLEEAANAFESVLSGERQETEPAEKKAPQPTEPTDEAEDDEGEDAQESEAADEGEEGQESEGDEPDDKSESEDDPEGEEGEEDVYAVTVDGQEIEVPASELVKGYQRNADYTRKTQALAEERRSFHGEVQQTRVLRDQYAQGLQQLEAVLQQGMPQEPDWNELRRTDPIEFAAAWAEHQQRQQQAQRITAERQALEEQRSHETAAQKAQFLAKARDWLTDRIPEWKDPVKAKAERAAMRDFGLKQGYTPEELQAIDDPRAVLIIRMAMRHARAQEKAKQVTDAPRKVQKPTGQRAPVLKPGAAPAAKQQRTTSDLTRAKQRLAKTGSTTDAADVFLKTILR